MKTILFQGDSITDTGRSRDFDPDRGYGYATLITSELTYLYPNKYITYNRGASSSRIVDLYARLKVGFINLKPDVISILIGVNSVWHELAHQNGVDADRYYDIYCMLIEDLKKALPQVKIIILEPFCLKGEANEAWWEEFDSGVRLRAVKAKAVAEKYDLEFIPLQDKFETAAKTGGNACWLRDGVHPTAAGHELIKREWIKVFETMEKE